MRTRAQKRAEQKLESQPQEQLPAPIIDTKMSAPGLTQSQSQDSPMAIDSDTEADFRNDSTRPQSRRNRRSAHIHGSAAASTGISAQEIRRAFANRRPWITSYQNAEGDSGDDIPHIDYGAATPDPPPEREPVEQPEPPVSQPPLFNSTSMPTSPSALFNRLRTASFSPFSSIRNRGRIFGAKEGEQPVAMASSESSSDDDDLSILSGRRNQPRNVRDSYSDEDEEYDAHESQDL